jgi:hypothetical protein
VDGEGECIMKHIHEWREVHEQMLFAGGTYIVGWECVYCKEYVSQNELTPNGLDGIISKTARCGNQIVGENV